MKIVKTGYSYRIYDDSLETFDLLPPHSYQLVFKQLQGFSLEEIEDVKVTEKIYGIHQQKVDKIMKSFDLFERNLGVILSGDRGIGKSVSAKLLAQEALKKFLPVIFVNSYVPGVASYIASIKQPVVVIFDEFDKTFSNKDEENDCQAEMLTLFDGIYPGKKLFVITCNNINHLNEFLINRPGRFHYHLRFNYPSPEEIQEYLKDKLKPEYYDQIPKVVSFSGRVDLNYDCLRAIVFELNAGESFEKCIGDLNIVNIDDRDAYSVTVIFKNGMKATCKRAYFDPYEDDREETIRFNLEDNSAHCYLDVETGDCKFDYEKGVLIIDGSCVQGEIEWCDHEGDEIEEANLPNRSMIDHLVLKRRYPKSIHYTV